jgi:hypothetical protein
MKLRGHYTIPGLFPRLAAKKSRHRLPHPERNDFSGWVDLSTGF